MKRLALAAALVLVLPAGAADGKGNRRYFPLRLGNSWTFRTAPASGRTEVMRVVRQSGGTFRLVGFPGTDRLVVRWSRATLEAWDEQDHRWETLLRLGAQAGTTYAVNLARFSLWSNVRVSITSRRAVARVLRRVVRSSISLSFRYKPIIADAGLVSMTLAPGLGVVDWSEQSLAGPVAYELTSARIGNKRF